MSGCPGILVYTFLLSCSSVHSRHCTGMGNRCCCWVRRVVALIQVRPSVPKKADLNILSLVLFLWNLPKQFCLFGKHSVIQKSRLMFSVPRDDKKKKEKRQEYPGLALLSLFFSGFSKRLSSKGNGMRGFGCVCQYVCVSVW